ncbi:MAG: hypothetical protein WBA46_08955, partial [Thermomicrobiales bacterium]
ATDTPEATATATMGDETPVSTATEAPTLVPTEPAANPTAAVQVASLPSTGQGDGGSGMGMGIIGLLGLATVFAGLAGWRIRHR